MNTLFVDSDQRWTPPEVCKYVYYFVHYYHMKIFMHFVHHRFFLHICNCSSLYNFPLYQYMSHSEPQNAAVGVQKSSRKQARRKQILIGPAGQGRMDVGGVCEAHLLRESGGMPPQEYFGF